VALKVVTASPPTSLANAAHSGSQVKMLIAALAGIAARNSKGRRSLLIDLMIHDPL
jgi:hypothetical protein